MSGKLDKNKIAVIHFQPVELYPPGMNLVNHLGKYTHSLIFLISNSLNKKINLKHFSSDAINIDIVRPSVISGNFLLRYFNYLKFYWVSFFYLFYYRPAVVIYFETISSFPALVYKKLFSKAKIMVHYHEYTNPNEYKNGMRLVRYFHNMEIRLYRQFEWISHTNLERLRRFRNDFNLLDIPDSLFHSMPNYPSYTWCKKNNNLEGERLKLVYVGSLGLETSYFRELIDWVLHNQKYISLDIYSFNIKKDALDVIQDLPSESIQYKGYVDYFEMPNVLINYHTGLVIYKPLTENYLYNAPNKIFEYLACGLNVIIPDSMNYAIEYVNQESNQSIVSVDFANLQKFDFNILLQKKPTSDLESNFIAEFVYPEILACLKNIQQEKHD